MSRTSSTRGARPTVVDIGSGGGIPGLVVANDRPDLAVTLVDRRQKCADFLERSVAALGFRDRVTVRCCDTSALILAGERFDAVTARGFGPPSRTLQSGGRSRAFERPDRDQRAASRRPLVVGPGRAVGPRPSPGRCRRRLHPCPADGPGKRDVRRSGQNGGVAPRGVPGSGQNGRARRRVCPNPDRT